MGHYLQDELLERLRSDNEIWDFLQQSCLDGLWYWDLEKPEHEWMSPEFWGLFGYDPNTKAHAPESWFDIIDPDDKAVALENFNRHAADPDHPYDQIVRYRHADGSTVWVRCRGLAMRDANGKAIRMLGAHSDLTGFVEASAAREKETATIAARLSAVVNAAQSGIIGLDAQRNIVTLNPPARMLLGLSEAVGHVAWPEEIQFLDGADMHPLDASNDPVNRALAGANLGGEIHLMTHSGGDLSGRYVRISSARVEQVGSDVHTVIVIDDISEQERNRQQIERQSRLDALGQLTGGISHDFNNLLSTILYAATMLQSEPQSERGTRLLNETLRTVERGRELTSRLLAFAKQQPQDPTHCSVSKIFNEFGRLVQMTIEEHIEIRMQPTSSDLAVHCDPHLLENALLNLVLNSRDAIMRSGQGDQITLVAEIETAPLELEPPQTKGSSRIEEFVKVSVIDNGPGMDAETRRRATDPFFTTKATNSGSGLGLSMVFGFVQQANGKLHITSEPNNGTSIDLFLPKCMHSQESTAANVP